MGYKNARNYESRFYQKEGLSLSSIEIQKQKVQWKDGRVTTERFYSKPLAELMINYSRRPIAGFIKFYLRDCFKQLKKEDALNSFNEIWERYQSYHQKKDLIQPFNQKEFLKLARKVQLIELEMKAKIKETHTLIKVLENDNRQLNIKLKQTEIQIEILRGETL